MVFDVNSSGRIYRTISRRLIYVIFYFNETVKIIIDKISNTYVFLF